MFTSIHINTDTRDIKTCLSIFYISYFHRKPYLLHVQCSDSSVVPSFAVLAQYVLGKLPGCILNERERSYTGLQCLLHRGSPYSPLCCMSGFALYTRDCPITLETLLCGKTAKMWEGMRVAPLVMPSLSANFWVHFARRRLILRRGQESEVHLALLQTHFPILSRLLHIPHLSSSIDKRGNYSNTTAEAMGLHIYRGLCKYKWHKNTNSFL